MDFPSQYPQRLDSDLEPRVIDSLNMNRLTCLQLSYWWQLHLPFMLIHLASHPWVKHYTFKYDTLPIMKVSPNQWTLDPFVAER